MVEVAVVAVAVFVGKGGEVNKHIREREKDREIGGGGGREIGYSMDPVRGGSNQNGYTEKRTQNARVQCTNNSRGTRTHTYC